MEKTLIEIINEIQHNWLESKLKELTEEEKREILDELFKEDLW